MNKKLISPFQAWKFHRDLAFDILKSISDEQLKLTVGENMGTLGMQFRHILKIEIEYLEAIKNKKVAPVERSLNKDLWKSKDALLLIYHDIETRMTELLDSISEDSEKYMIDWKHWSMDEMNLVDHMQALADHNNLHNGEIIVYARTHSVPFPKSWEPWGL